MLALSISVLDTGFFGWDVEGNIIDHMCICDSREIGLDCNKTKGSQPGIRAYFCLVHETWK